MNDQPETHSASSRPLAWHEVAGLPRETALTRYIRGLRECEHAAAPDFFITQAHAPEAWRDTHQGLTREPPGARLLTACLPSEPTAARSQAKTFNLPVDVPGPGAFESPRAFLTSWLNFLDTQPPRELAEFLRRSFFMPRAEARESALAIMENSIEDSLPYGAAFEFLDRTGLWRVFAPAVPDDAPREPWEDKEPLAYRSQAFIAGEQEAYKLTRLTVPRFLILLLTPGLIHLALSRLSKTLGDVVGMPLTLVSLLVIIFMVTRNAYRRFRPRLLDGILMEGVPLRDVVRAFRAAGDSFSGLLGHVGRMRKDAYVRRGDELRAMLDGLPP